IFHHVWNYPGYSGSNVVDQYVSYVRRRIDKPFGVSQLETLRGVGYRLRNEPAALDGIAPAEATPTDCVAG
ncbi:MAG: two component transcriptional regulator, winged helix family, partial [Mycobacterium sp.]|nr:two component transcriptional regulator, winged helix family [Mycobacterium sp.]